jgi:hypothetical protein
MHSVRVTNAAAAYAFGIYLVCVMRSPVVSVQRGGTISLAKKHNTDGIARRYTDCEAQSVCMIFYGRALP